MNWRTDMYVEFLGSGLGRIIRTQRYKYIRVYNTLSDAKKGVKNNGAFDANLLLFDMENDPEEKINLAFDSNYCKVIQEHEKALADWENKLEWNPSVSTTGG